MLDIKTKLCKHEICFRGGDIAQIKLDIEKSIMEAYLCSRSQNNLWLVSSVKKWCMNIGQ